MTQAEQLRLIGAAIGRPLRWEELSREDARPDMIEIFGDASLVDSSLDTWAGFVSTPELVTTIVQDITGVPARTFGQWAADNAAAFR